MDELSTIRILRKLNVSIKEIKVLFRQNTLDKVQTLLSEQVLTIDEEIQKLLYYKKNVQLLLNEMNDFKKNASVELKIRPKLYSIIVDSVIDNFENSLLKTTNTILKELQPYNLWFTFSQNISVISQQNLEFGNYHIYSNNGIISQQPLELNTQNIQYKTYPEVLCMFKAVIVTDESFSSIDYHYRSIKSWASKHGFIINGDSMEVNIYNQKNKSYIQIWIPVKEN